MICPMPGIVCRSQVGFLYHHAPHTISEQAVAIHIDRMNVDACIGFLTINKCVFVLTKIGSALPRPEHLHPSVYNPRLLGHDLRRVAKDNVRAGTVQVGVDRLVRAFARDRGSRYAMTCLLSNAVYRIRRAFQL